mgnify:CR=1 FL=1
MIVLYNNKVLDIFSGKSPRVWGMAIFPFILVREDLRGSSEARYTINHEMIHIRQQAELLLVFFMLWYYIPYLARRFRGYSPSQAYMMSRFEKEAYANMYDLRYLNRRRPFSFLKKSCLR